MLSLYNTLSKKKESLPKRSLNWYTCGPTIYNRSHLGHGMTFVAFDLLVRSLRAYNYEINHLMNITDIDDKILHKVQIKHWESMLTEEDLKSLKNDDKVMYRKNLIEYLEPKFSEKELTPTKKEFLFFVDKMFEHFLNDMASLGITVPKIVRVTETINELVGTITKLIERGFAYESNGSVYFDSKAFEDKGFDFSPFKRFSEGMSNVEVKDKKDIRDFVIWKKKKKYEIGFDAPFGEGRPGWHIECNVIIDQIFGSKLDVHAGGCDLAFPHHNNEHVIAQAMYENKNWAKYFFHTGHVHIGGEKMSQSLGNFEYIHTFLNKYSARTFRILVLLHHWRSTLNLDEETMIEAINYDKMFDEFFKNVYYLRKKGIPSDRFNDEDESLLDEIENLTEEAGNAILDDFKTNDSMITIGKIITKVNTEMRKEIFSSVVFESAISNINQFLDMWGLDYSEKVSSIQSSTLIDLLVNERDFERDLGKKLLKLSKKIEDLELKKTLKDLGIETYKRTDTMRDFHLKALGIQLEDGRYGTKWLVD